MNKHKLLFISGTRADFGKIKPLVQNLSQSVDFDIHLFVTGMHMLRKYGHTYLEVEALRINKTYKFINQNENDSLDTILYKTISGLSDYVHQIRPDIIVVHGDRVEALAGALVGALNNIKTAHIEGGEISGTIDESMRHAISKLSHVHFVSNKVAVQRLLQLGENKNNIHNIGSPDLDIMLSDKLPLIEKVMEHYCFSYKKYGILLYHSVTSEQNELKKNIALILNELIESGLNYIVIYPNNDPGSSIILEEYSRLEGNIKFKIYPSMRFEYFLTLLKNAEFIIGNSSAGIREAPYYMVPTINIGNRQHGRFFHHSIANVKCTSEEIKNAIKNIHLVKKIKTEEFGDGKSAEQFCKILRSKKFFNIDIQKYFFDRAIKE